MQLPQIVSPDFTPHWREDMSSDEYHADATAVGSGRLKRIDKSAANFYSAFVQEQEPDEGPKLDAFRLGSALHMAVLEPKLFAQSFVQLPEFAGTGSRAAKLEWMAAQPKGVLLLSAKEYQQVEGMVNSVLRSRQASNLLKLGKAEISGYYRDEETGIKCKFRPDFITLNSEITLIDLKTTQDASASMFSKSIAQYSYHMQMAMYCEGVRHVMGKLPYYAIYMVIEKTPPYEVAVYIADEIILTRGYEMYRRCMDKLGECLRANKWPGLQPKGLETISLPIWAQK